MFIKMIILGVIILIAMIIVAVIKLKSIEESHKDTFRQMIDGLSYDQLDSMRNSLNNLKDNPKKDEAIELINEELNKRSK